MFFEIIPTVVWCHEEAVLIDQAHVHGPGFSDISGNRVCEIQVFQLYTVSVTMA